MATSTLTLHVHKSVRNTVVNLLGNPSEETLDDEHLELGYEEAKWAGSGPLTTLAQTSHAFIGQNGPGESWGPGETVGFGQVESYRQLNEDGEFFVLVNEDGSINEKDHMELEKHFKLRRLALEVIDGKV